MPSILAERLADRVDAVIGVDTHTDTHTAAVLTAVGTVLAEVTVDTAGADGVVFKQGGAHGGAGDGRDLHGGGRALIRPG